MADTIETRTFKMTTTLRTKKFTLETKPAVRSSRSSSRPDERSLPILIRLPDLSSQETKSTNQNLDKADQSKPSTNRPGADAEARSSKDKQKKTRTKKQSRDNESRESSSWGWQIVVGICLIGFFGMAYSLLTGGADDDSPIDPANATDGLFIDLPNEMDDEAGNVVVTDDEPSSEANEHRENWDSSDTIGATSEPVNNSDLLEAKPHDREFEFNEPSNRVSKFSGNKGLREWRDGQIVERGSTRPDERAEPRSFPESTPEYPTTDPDTYLSPQDFHREWRTGDRNNSMNDSHGSNRVERRQPGMATLQGIIKPPPYQNRERR